MRSATDPTDSNRAAENDDQNPASSYKNIDVSTQPETRKEVKEV